MNTVGSKGAGGGSRSNGGRGQMMWVNHVNYMKAAMAAHGDKEKANRTWNAMLQNPQYAKKESELGRILIGMLVSSKILLPL